jgi:hypothetical protein
MPPGEEKKKGRPRVRWIRGIEENIAQRGGEEEQWMSR